MFGRHVPTRQGACLVGCTYSIKWGVRVGTFNFTSPAVCSLRLDFETFTLRSTTGTTVTGIEGECQDTFVVTAVRNGQGGEGRGEGGRRGGDGGVGVGVVVEGRGLRSMPLKTVSLVAVWHQPGHSGAVRGEQRTAL